jgi:hypothetical protein
LDKEHNPLPNNQLCDIVSRSNVIAQWLVGNERTLLSDTIFLIGTPGIWKKKGEPYQSTEAKVSCFY